MATGASCLIGSEVSLHSPIMTGASTALTTVNGRFSLARRGIPA